MLRRIKLQAARVESPFLRLLLLDWRFAGVLVLIGLLLVAGGAAPLKLWRRTPPGFAPEVRISAVDWFQARALSRAARAAESRGDFELALTTWTRALANDPGSPGIASGNVLALLRSDSPAARLEALRTAAWLRAIHPGPRADELMIRAAERAQAWDLVLEMVRAAPHLDSMEVRLAQGKALFRTRRYAEAEVIFKGMQGDSGAVYRAALRSLLHGDRRSRQELRGLLQHAADKIDAHEVCLVVCAEERQIGEYRTMLAGLKQLTDQTLDFDLLLGRLLWETGNQAEARRLARALPPPRTALETFRIGECLAGWGEPEEALRVLRRYASEFTDSAAPWILYARLLLPRGDQREMRSLLSQVEARARGDVFAALSACLRMYLRPGDCRIDQLQEILQQRAPGPTQASIWYFAADVLLRLGEARAACDTLQLIEPEHRSDPEFYARLFAAGEACRDAALMRRAAERSYALLPQDPLAAANYAAMLTMFDEQTDIALRLSAWCHEVQPASVAAQINYAAALLNAEDFARADLLLRGVDSARLSKAGLNQLRFIKLRRAVRLGDAAEAARLAARLDRSRLYSRQASWLRQNSL